MIKNKLIGGKKIGEGGYGCVFHPEIDCRGKETTNKKYVSKIQMNDYSSKNEIYIGEYLTDKLKNDPQNFLSNNFAPVISSCGIDFKYINNNLVKSCDILKKHKLENKFVISKIRYIDMEDFDNYIIKQLDDKTMILTLLDSYKHILTSIEKLIELNVIHFDLKGPNIVFDIKKNIPILIDFGLSIKMDKLIMSNLYNYFYVYAPQYYIWPLEVHYMNLLIHVTTNPTKEHLLELAKEYTLKNSALISMSEEFKNKFINLCYKTLLSYDKLSLEDKKTKIISSWKTWDNYSLSVMYIKILYYINKSANNKLFNNKFIGLLIELFLTNIHPDFTKRKTTKETQEIFKSILNLDDNLKLLQELKENILTNSKKIGKEIELESKKVKMLNSHVKHR